MRSGWLPSLDELSVHITHQAFGTRVAVSFHVSALPGKALKILTLFSSILSAYEYMPRI
jgi:hypothetical protein